MADLLPPDLSPTIRDAEIIYGPPLAKPLERSVSDVHVPRGLFEVVVRSGKYRRFQWLVQRSANLGAVGWYVRYLSDDGLDVPPRSLRPPRETNTFSGERAITAPSAFFAGTAVRTGFGQGRGLGRVRTGPLRCGRASP